MSNEPTLQDVLSRIDALGSTLNSRIDELDSKLNTLDGKVDALDSKVDVLDGKVDVLDGRMDALDGRMDALDGRMDALDGKVVVLTREMETHGRWVRGELSYMRDGLAQDIVSGLVDVLQERGLIEGRRGAEVEQ